METATVPSSEIFASPRTPFSLVLWAAGVAEDPAIVRPLRAYRRHSYEAGVHDGTALGAEAVCARDGARASLHQQLAEAPLSRASVIAVERLADEQADTAEQAGRRAAQLAR